MKPLKRTLSLDTLETANMFSALSTDDESVREPATQATATVASAPAPKQLRRSNRRATSKGILKSNSMVAAQDTELVSNLKVQIEDLQSTVSTLVSKVNFLLSFVGAVETTSSSPRQLDRTVMSATTNSSTTESVSESAHTIPTLVSGSTVSAVNRSFAAVAQQTSASGIPSQPMSIREAAVAAVYIDKAEAQRRTASFIVSGLAPSNSCTDRNLVSHLCDSELNVHPDITFTKRVGRSVPERCQSLLVYVKQPEQAKLIVSLARRLRESQDAYVRDSVYINQNLTKAAARAAYELRCRRRQAMERKLDQRHSTESRPQHGPAAELSSAPSARSIVPSGNQSADALSHHVGLDSSAIHVSQQSHLPGSSSTSSSTLNPHANPYPLQCPGH